jgi:hypothetical protein
VPPNLDRRLRPRMTLRQISVIVVFAAIGSAVMVREPRSADNVLGFLLLEVPVAFIPTTLIMVRRGPLKIWFLVFLCAVPLLSFLVELNLFVFYGPFVHWRGSDQAAILLVALAGCDAFLIAGLAVLARWLVPRPCPLCGWWAMLRDPSVPRSRHFPTPTEPRLCLGCGARVRRPKGAPWVDVDTIPDEPVPAGLAKLLAPILSRKGDSP